MEQRQLVGLITRRSRVRIPSPQPMLPTQDPAPWPGFLIPSTGPLSRLGRGAVRQRVDRTHIPCESVLAGASVTASVGSPREEVRGTCKAIIFGRSFPSAMDSRVGSWGRQSPPCCSPPCFQERSSRLPQGRLAKVSASAKKRASPAATTIRARSSRTAPSAVGATTNTARWATDRSAAASSPRSARQGSAAWSPSRQGRTGRARRCRTARSSAGATTPTASSGTGRPVRTGRSRSSWRA